MRELPGKREKRRRREEEGELEVELTSKSWRCLGGSD
jgi:hypothetical protein